jgi:hypothetical protein
VLNEECPVVNFHYYTSISERNESRKGLEVLNMASKSIWVIMTKRDNREPENYEPFSNGYKGRRDEKSGSASRRSGGSCYLHQHAAATVEWPTGCVRPDTVSGQSHMPSMVLYSTSGTQ